MNAGFLLLFLSATPVLFGIQPAAALDKVYTDSNGMEFVLIPAGTFMMGCGAGDTECHDDEKPQHEVRIKKIFYMGRYEVTQKQWEAVMGDNPCFHKDPAHPVDGIPWDNVQDFISKLNEHAPKGLRYRLPTEAEWEYAARAGNTAVYSFGDQAGILSEYAWFSGKRSDGPHPVGQKKPNAWGLYDMYGNVYEWVQDWYDRDGYKALPEDDPVGPASGTARVLRGGGWYSLAKYCRSSFRYCSAPDGRNHNYGFRLVLAP